MTEALHIAVYQYTARDEEAATRLERLDRVAARVAADGAHLLVAPELFLCGYRVGAHAVDRAEPADGPSAAAACAIAARHGIALVYGYPERAGERVYNAALCVGPDGAALANHRKVQPYGEAEKGVFAAGDRVTTFGLHGHRVAVLICYDVEFPELVRGGALAGATVFAVPTALYEIYPFVARHMVRTRAFENCVHLAYANMAGTEDGRAYLGESCIIGPGGEELARAGDGEAVIDARADPARIAEVRTVQPYLRDLRGGPIAVGESGA